MRVIWDSSGREAVHAPDVQKKNYNKDGGARGRSVGQHTRGEKEKGASVFRFKK